MSEANLATDPGCAFVVSWRGRQWKVAPEDHLEVIGQYEAFLEDQSWQGLKRALTREQISAAEYTRLAGNLVLDIGADLLGYGSQRYAASTQSARNQRRLVLIMLAYHQGAEVTPELVKTMMDDPAFMEPWMRGQEVYVKKKLASVPGSSAGSSPSSPMIPGRSPPEPSAVSA